MSVSVRLGEEDAADPIDLSPKTRRAIADEAAFRRVSVPALVAMLLEAVVQGDQFGEVLQKGGRP